MRQASGVTAVRNVRLLHLGHVINPITCVIDCSRYVLLPRLDLLVSVTWNAVLPKLKLVLQPAHLVQLEGYNPKCYQVAG